MKIAICGYGGMGSHHAQHIIPTTSKNLEVIGAYDIREERLEQAQKDGYIAYDSYEALLNDKQVDIVLIATPNDFHKDQAIAALRSGKHVVCEKPVTLSSEQLEAIVEVEKETGKVFMVHQNRRWDEDYLVIKNLYENHQIGEVFHIESRVHGANGIPGDWRCKAKHGGGMLYDWGVHLLDQILDMVDSPLKTVYSDQSFVLGHDSDDGFTSYLKFENGVTAQIEVATTNFITLPRWYVKGLKGTAVIHDWNLNGEMIEYNYEAEHIAPTPIKAGAGLTKTMAPLNEGSVIKQQLPRPLEQKQSFYENFVSTVNKETEPIIKNSEVLRVMRLIEAMFASYEHNQVIEFE